MYSFFNLRRGHLPPVESWALKNANKCSADEIIAAALINRMAKDFISISCQEFSKQLGHIKKELGRPKAIMTFPSEITLILFRRGWIKGRSRDGNRLSPRWFYPDGEIISATVNGVEFSLSEARLVYSSYLKLKRTKNKATEVADKALADQQRTEFAWNLAEKLLGMKRNEFGALVPVNPIEDN